jgi:hypothetical protein
MEYYLLIIGFGPAGQGIGKDSAITERSNLKIDGASFQT